MPEELEAIDHRIQRWVITAAVVGSGLVFWRGANDIFSTPKQLVVFLGAIVVIGLSVFRFLARGEIRIVRSPATIALGVFVVLGLVTAVHADAHGHAFFGQHGRATGYLLYLAAALLFLGATRSFDRRSVERFLGVFLGGSTLIALYGLVQRTGHDPFTWAQTYGPRAAFSSLGNTNFASGYLAIAVPVAAWFVVAGRSGIVRVLGFVAGVLACAGIVATESSQGILAAGAGFAAVVLVRIIESPPRLRRPLLGGFAAAAVLAVVIGVLGLAGRGPLDRLNDQGFDYRRDYWRASLSMVGDHPIAGVGFDMWAGYFRAERSATSAQRGLATVTDEPHSVPLSMLTSGGLPLGLAYGTFVVLIGWAAVAGLARFRGRDRQLLGAVAGMWLAYQVQSFVSIDVPAFPAVHFVTAGLVLACSGATWWTWRLAPLTITEQAPFRPGKHRQPRPPATHRPRIPVAVAAAVAAVLALPLAWQSLRPFRAEVHVERATNAAREGDSAAYLRELNHATKLARWEPAYWAQAADAFNRTKRLFVGSLLYDRAMEQDRRSFATTLNAARTAKALHEVPKALDLYKRALVLEPHAPELRTEVAEYYIDVDLEKAAGKVLEPVLVDTPAAAEAWRVLGDLRRDEGDIDGARRAYEHAVKLDPRGGAAEDRLRDLDQQNG